MAARYMIRVRIEIVKPGLSAGFFIGGDLNEFRH